MKLYNSRTRQIAPFQPTSNEVAVLVCGLKLDRAMHLDHIFTYCAADVLVRYLERKGWPVRFAQGIINIEKDMPKKVLAGSGVRRSLGDCNIGSFIENMQSLNVRPPDYLFGPAVECSEQAAKFLGKTIDIHIGGEDSHLHGDRPEFSPVEAINRQKPAVRFWLQTASADQKTEESGNWPDNLVMVDDVLKRTSPDVLRIYLAKNHYRMPWTYDEVALERAARWIAKLEAALTAVSSGRRPIDVAPAQNRFRAAMDNDLDTAKGIATILNLADEILFRAPNAYRIDEAQAELRRMASIFGLRLDQDGVLFEEPSINGWNKHRQHFEENWREKEKSSLDS